MNAPTALNWARSGLLAACAVALGACDRSDAARPEESAALSEIAHLRSELEAERARSAELARELEELEGAFSDERARRVEREEQFLDVTRLLGSLDANQPSLDSDLARELLGLAREVETPAPEPDPEAQARALRLEEVHRTLRALLRANEVDGLDLVEVGDLHPDGLGPVLFRITDAYGRTAGSLVAERLRLSGSRAGHVVTLVLIGGSERRAGEEFPFVGGQRRLPVPYVDPEPWMEALPELFEPEDLAGPADDGAWDLVRVRRDLNRLLRVDAAGGYYQIKDLGGIQDGVLHDVHVLAHDAEGRIKQHLFADLLRVVRGERGVRLLLEDGVSMRGDQKAPFLDGRYRIFLPRAEHDDWRAARVPGFYDPFELDEGDLEPRG